MLDPKREIMSPLARIRDLEARVSVIEGVGTDPFARLNDKPTIGQAGPSGTVSAADSRLRVSRVNSGPNMGNVITPAGATVAGNFVVMPDLQWFNVKTDVDTQGFVTLHPASEMGGGSRPIGLNPPAHV